MRPEEILEELEKIGIPDWLGSKSELEKWFDRYCAIMSNQPVPWDRFEERPKTDAKTHKEKGCMCS